MLALLMYKACTNHLPSYLFIHSFITAISIAPLQVLVPWLGWTEFCVRLPVLLGGCPSFLPSLPTCVMYSIGCQYLSGYSIVSLQWYPVVSLDVPPLTSASSAAQCRFWPHVGCCILLRGASFWSLVPIWLLCSEGPFRL